jgi:predicted methyltransferase
MNWHPKVDQTARGKELMEKYKINTYQLTNCSVCHY